MNFDEYQILSSRTLPTRSGLLTAKDRLVLALGLCGEAGETGDYLKKIEGHGHEVTTSKLESELGDVLWYVAAIATAYSISLDTIADKNIKKLLARYPEGFNTRDSIGRVDEKLI